MGGTQMLRVSWKSALTLLVTALLTVGAAQPEGCSGESNSQERDRRSMLELQGGHFIVTGHAPDFHAVDDSGAVRLLIRSLAYVRAGNPLPFLWVESRIAPPEGHRSGKDGLRTAGFMEGQDFLHMDAAQLGAMPASWWSTLSTRFSAIAVASDRALLTQAELDVLKNHRADIAGFLKEQRGLLALSESGTGAALTQRDRYEFLPLDMFSSAGATPPYSVTAFGEQALGVTRDDVNSPAYNHFDGSFGFDAVTLSDANGAIIALAGQVTVSDEYLFANAGVDGTFYGPGLRIPVTLDGSGSTTDSASYPLHYVWVLGDEVLADTDQPVVTVDLLPGVYEIQLILSNGSNNVATDEVVVTVIQKSVPPSGPPTITCPADVVVATAPATCGAQAYFPPPSVSAPGGEASVSCSSLPGSTFPGGVTPVTCTVVDPQGQSASCGFTVTVNDQEPPTIASTTPSQDTLWPPDHKLVRVGVSVDVTDNCGGGGADGAVQCHLVNVTSNEPINGRGDGNTDWDWDIVGPLSVDLRAERAGPLTTRIYTLWVDCMDASGLTATGTTTVTVVHDQGASGAGRSLGN